jgi:hypothetical protein
VKGMRDRENKKMEIEKVTKRVKLGVYFIYPNLCFNILVRGAFGGRCPN